MKRIKKDKVGKLPQGLQRMGGKVYINFSVPDLSKPHPSKPGHYLTRQVREVSPAQDTKGALEYRSRRLTEELAKVDAQREATGASRPDADIAKLTLAQLLARRREKYESEVRQRNASLEYGAERTKDALRHEDYRAASCLKAFGETTLACQLSETTIRAQIQKWLDKGYAPNTINEWLLPLRAAYNLKAVKRAMPTPFEDLHKLEKTSRDRIITAAEFQSILIAAPEPFRSIFILAQHTGQRRSDIARMRWEDLELTEETPVWNLKEGKGAGKTARALPLIGEALATIQRLLAQIVGPARGYIFRAVRDPAKHIGRQNVTEAWAKACKRAGVEGATLHDNRHTFVTSLLEGDVDLAIVMEMTGHRVSKQAMEYANKRRLTGRLAREMAKAKPL